MFASDTNGAMRISIGILAILAVLFPLSSHAKETLVEQLPTPLQVLETSAELQALGCYAVTEKGGSVNTPDDVTYLIEPPDAQDSQHVFCPVGTISQLTQADGKVAGITSEALAAESANCLSVLGTAAGGAVENLLGDWANCALAGFERAPISGITNIGGNFAISTILSVLQWLVAVFVGLGMLILFGGVALVNFALSPTQFATHDVVRQMWPVILGIANLGFILALLAIAFGTVLQIQDFAARRMLPRLLFAALLINFSLLVGTLIVDASRLAMAIELTVLNNNQGVNDVTEVGNQILAASQLDQVVATAFAGGKAVLSFQAQPLSDAWTGLLLTVFAGILVWGTAIGFLVIGVMLVVRYIAILLLLIASPLAFLFIAIPRAGQLAGRWWTEFIKYVLYGPVVLLILIVLLRAQEVANFFGRIPQGQPQLVSWFTLVATTAVTIVLLYMAAVAGRYLGLAGAAATVSFVSGKAKQTARLYGTGLAKGAYVASGARAGIRQARDFGKEVRSGVAKSARSGGLFGKTGFGGLASRVARGVAGPERKADGTLAAGETSTGLRAAQGLLREFPSGADDRAAIQTAQSINPSSYSGSIARAQAAAAAGNLAVAKSEGESAINKAMDDAGIGDRLTADGQKAIVGKLADPNFTLNLPVDLLKTVMQHGSDNEKKAVGAALATADMTGLKPDKRKEIVKAVVESGDKTVLKNVVNNVDFVEHMGGGDKAKIFQMSDDKLTNSLVRTIQRNENRKK